MLKSLWVFMLTVSQIWIWFPSFRQTQRHSICPGENGRRWKHTGRSLTESGRTLDRKLIARKLAHNNRTELRNPGVQLTTSPRKLCGAITVFVFVARLCIQVVAVGCSCTEDWKRRNLLANFSWTCYQHVRLNEKNMLIELNDWQLYNSWDPSKYF